MLNHQVIVSVSLLILSVIQKSLQQCDIQSTEQDCNDNSKDYCYYQPVNEQSNFPKCKTVSYSTDCVLIKSKDTCLRGSCVWSNTLNKCVEWSEGECEAYYVDICKYGIDCQIVTDPITQKSQCSPIPSCSRLLLQNLCLDNQDSLNCYWDEQENSLVKCKEITAKAPCEKIKEQTSCLTTTCEWFNGKCYYYNDKDLPCSSLSSEKCQLGFNCVLDNSICIQNLRCSDIITKENCEISSLGCYFDQILNNCQRINGDTWCNDLSNEQDCQQALCVWNKNRTPNLCQEINKVSCDQLQEDNCNFGKDCIWEKIQNKCVDASTLLTMCQLNKLNCQTNVMCVWENEACYLYNQLESQCLKMRDFKTCTELTYCYFSEDDNECYAIDSETPCNYIPNNESCLVGTCIWFEETQECLEYFYAPCEILKTEQLCYYGNNCRYMKSEEVCVKDYTCEVLGDLSIQCDIDPLCNFNYEENKCETLSIKTTCSSIGNGPTCNSALCIWEGDNDLFGNCLEYHLAPCNLFINQEQCKYSPNCVWNNDVCQQREVCGRYNMDYEACVQSDLNCWYDQERSLCKPINGETYCKDIEGHANCLVASCQLQPLEGDLTNIVCLEYDEAQCEFMSNDYCHFGDCVWKVLNSTAEQCQNHRDDDENNQPDKDETSNTVDPPKINYVTVEQIRNQDLLKNFKFSLTIQILWGLLLTLIL